MTTSSAALEDKIVACLQILRPEVDFSASQAIVSEGLLDSFDLLMVVEAFEKEFKVVIGGEEIIPSNFESIQSMRDLVGRCKKR